MTSTAAYLTAGLRPLGAEPTYFDLLPQAGSTMPTTNGLPSPPPDPYIPALVTQAVQRHHTMKVLGCKAEIDAVRIGRVPVSDAGTHVAHQGYGRHQRHGLAFDPRHPLNTPLMPQASSFYGGMNNQIPLPQ